MSVRRRPAQLEIMSSNLPPYLTVLVEQAATLRGRVQIDDETAPTWITDSGSLLNLDESDGEVSKTIEAEPGENGTRVTYSIIDDISNSNRGLPFGLFLDTDSGEIKGEVERNLLQADDPTPFFEEDRPVWDDDNQELEKEIEMLESIEIDLKVESVSDTDLHFHIPEGALPFGLFIHDSKIKGTPVVSIDNTPFIDEDLLTPRWRTSFGLIDRKNEKEDFEYQLEATPREGEEIRYQIVKGALPWGINLTDDGLLKGTVGEIIFPEPPAIIDNNAPLITNSDKTLARVDKGEEVDIELKADVYNGRELERFVILTKKEEIRTGLPFGLTLNHNKIVGKVDEDAIAGVYVFTVVVYDSIGEKSSRTFHIEVREGE